MARHDKLGNLRLASLSEDDCKELSSFEIVSLARNILQKIPPAFATMALLSALDLSNNRFSEVPDVLSQLPSLTSLKMRCNQLRHLPADMGKRFSNLKLLDLGENELRAQCGSSLHHWASLETLLLDNNDFGSDVFVVSDMPLLRVLDVRKNRMTHMLQWQSSLPSLQELSVRSNRIQHVPSHGWDQMPALLQLDMGDNALHSAHSTSWHGLQSLQQLDVSYNKLVWCPELEGCTTLEVLRIHNNSVNDLKLISPSSMPVLRVLEASHNALTEVSDGLVELSGSKGSLEELVVSHNKIDRIPQFSQPLKLRRLDVKGNPITYDDVKDLIELELSGGISLCHFYETVPQRLVEEGLFIGSAESARNVWALKKLGITHIVNAAQGREINFPEHFSYLVLGLEDTDMADLTSVIGKAHAFIDSAIQAKQGVLIHCQAGVSRSVAIAASYLIKLRRMKALDALELIRQRRHNAKPIQHFVNSLIKLEEQLLNG